MLQNLIHEQAKRKTDDKEKNNELNEIAEGRGTQLSLTSFDIVNLMGKKKENPP